MVYKYLMDPKEQELLACAPASVSLDHFNHTAKIPFGCTVEHVCSAMTDFISFMKHVNMELNSKGLERIESMLMPANFSSIVGEFMSSNIPKYCKGLAKNMYHNGHPDLIPSGRHPNDAVQYAHEGIEVKGSRYLKAWQGHNPENIWLMVFVFDSNRPVDRMKGIPHKPFRFRLVVGAQLDKKDWSFAGRSAKSRRTITASVADSGYKKMMANWIYRDPELID